MIDSTKWRCKIPLLLLLIMGSLSALSGFREKTSGELARGASVCIVRYKNSDEFGDWRDTSDPDSREVTLPFETDGLNYTVTRHMEEKLYDDNVAWDRPFAIQIYCIVELTTNYTTTKTIVRDVRISELFNVSIIGGVPETPESSTIFDETIDQSVSDTIVSPVMMACMSLVLATGVCTYLAHISV